MAKRKIKPKVRREPAPPWLIKYLTTGERPQGKDKPFAEGAHECWTLEGNAKKLTAAWGNNKAGILLEWKKNSPGTRPWSWWAFDAPRWKQKFKAWFDGALPEPRERLGGIGTPNYEVLAYAPHFKFGIPASFVDQFSVDYYNGRARDIKGELIPCNHKEGDFMGVAIDTADPPAYESEASYLKRHGLLTKTEAARLSATDFEPVLIIEAE